MSAICPPEPGLHHVLIDAWEGLHTAPDASTFYRHCALLIRHHDKVPGEWIEELAALVSRPWKRGKGAPRKSNRLQSIEWDYFHSHVGGHRPRPVDAIASIAKTYGLTEAAATKLYQQAERDYAAKSYAFGAVIVHDDGN